jgi:hypothetical protein
MTEPASFVVQWPFPFGGIMVTLSSIAAVDTQHSEWSLYEYGMPSEVFIIQ